ncbi:MAG: hypothetical protein FJ090_14745 [Deltaproteobacteria bacterium]|nr:hypothetical protein [Deltaproteobacteria bacterium]
MRPARALVRLGHVVGACDDADLDRDLPGWESEDGDALVVLLAPEHVTAGPSARTIGGDTSASWATRAEVADLAYTQADRRGARPGHCRVSPAIEAALQWLDEHVTGEDWDRLVGDQSRQEFAQLVVERGEDIAEEWASYARWAGGLS